MAIVGAFLVVFVVLVRPQEFIPVLQTFSLLNAVTAFALIGIGIEIARGKQKLPWSPQWPWLAGFVVWCFVVTVRRLGVEGLGVAWDFVGLSAIFMLVVTCATRTFARWRALVGGLVVIGTFIACTCIHQSRQEKQCIAIDASGVEGDRSGEGAPDGRSCEDAYTCEQQGKPKTAYACEKVGLFETFTEGERVRWRGTLGDPNELALALGAIIPFAFAISSTVKKKWMTALMMAAAGIAIWCVVLTGSRGGQLVVITVLGVYFIRKYGLKGAIAGAMLALPVLMLGGRGGEEAESSSLERLNLLYEGMDMIRAYPVLGVGVGQFIDHATGAMTAHNSYVLAAAELGLPGSLLWMMLVYTSIKIPWVVATRPPPELDPRYRPLALALLVAFAGTLVGVFFLSFCYKAMLFVYFGLSGALFGAVRRVCPEFEVRVSLKEVGRVALADVAVLAFVLVYSRVTGAGA